MRSDISTITGSIVVFITFLISISILHYFIIFNSEKMGEILDKKTKFYHERSLELIDFLNNNTSAASPKVRIKNIGWISLDISCFKVYVDGVPVNFSYDIDDLNGDSLLNPGENCTLFLEPGDTGWKTIYLISCRGNRFESLVEYT